MHVPNKHHPELSTLNKRHNRLIARVRAAVERPFALCKKHFGMRRMHFFTRLQTGDTSRWVVWASIICSAFCAKASPSGGEELSARSCRGIHSIRAIVALK